LFSFIQNFSTTAINLSSRVRMAEILLCSSEIKIVAYNLT
jgi:hypothetical protein